MDFEPTGTVLYVPRVHVHLPSPPHHTRDLDYYALFRRGITNTTNRANRNPSPFDLPLAKSIFFLSLLFWGPSPSKPPFPSPLHVHVRRVSNNPWPFSRRAFDVSPWSPPSDGFTELHAPPFFRGARPVHLYLPYTVRPESPIHSRSVLPIAVHVHRAIPGSASLKSVP